MSKHLKHIKFSVNKFAVDVQNGILTNLALITADREAKGHGIYIDASTLKNGFESINQRGGQLKSVICHETFDQWWNEEDRLLEVPGYFSEISIKGNTLVAGKFEFYESFRTDQPAAYRRLMEMAEKTPNLFGLSIEASGYAVFMDTDGNEYSQRPEDVELMYDGLPVFRIVDLAAAAFVSEPAANDGLFATALSAIRSGKKLSKSQAEEIGKAFAAWNLQHNTTLTQTNTALDGQSPENNTHIMDKLLKAIKEKFGKNEARYNQAVLFAVNASAPENLTVDQIEAALDKVEIEELKAANAALKEKLETGNPSEDELTKLQKEKADLENRFKKLKDSGKETELSIGMPAIVGTSFKFSGTTSKLIEKNIISGDKVDNLSKKFAAGTTSVSDLWVPEILSQGMNEFAVERPVFMTSGAITSNADLNSAAIAGGNQVIIKHFVEPYFDSLLQIESTGPTVQKIVSGSQAAATLRRVSPLAVSAFAGAVSNSDPFGFIISILSNLRNRQDQTTAINALRGFMSTAAAALSEDNFTQDVTTDGTAGRLIDTDMVADAVARLGEVVEVLESGAMIVHSTIHASLKKQDSVTTIRDSQGQIVMRTYQGIPLFISDKLSVPGATSGTIYDSYIFGPGTLGIGSKPQTGNVGDTASLLIKEDEHTNDLVAYDRRQFILHPAGARWTGSPATANSGPTDAELATAGNWALGYTDAKRCGFVRIRTNG